jgi:excisionase family DNA binding protein
MIHSQGSSAHRRHEDAVRRAGDALQRALAPLPAREVEEFAGRVERLANGAVAQSPRSELSLALAGRNFNAEEQIRLEHLALLQRFQRRRELLQDALTVAEVAELLGTSRQTPHDRVRSGSLLAVNDQGLLRFPAWQFDPESQSGVVDGLPRVARLLRVSPLAKMSWLTSPSPYLAGATPLVAIKDGRVGQVAELARSVGRL